MKSPLSQPAQTLASLSLLLALCAADDCRPWTWTWDSERRVRREGTTSTSAAATATPNLASTTSSLLRPEVTRYAGMVDPQPGQLNCRSWGQTYDVVGYWSCNQLAREFSITIEKFWELNPKLAPDCEGIAPYTEYCVSGFIEPLRSKDGNCGPNHKNATCIGTDFGQCCNAVTWKCGATEDDCSAGICYEGLCPGHKIYTTDGNCGYNYGQSSCAGKWGDCCNLEGRCGTGEDFCAVGKCQLGNCTGWN